MENTTNTSRVFRPGEYNPGTHHRYDGEHEPFKGGVSFAGDGEFYPSVIVEAMDLAEMNALRAIVAAAPQLLAALYTARKVIRQWHEMATDTEHAAPAFRALTEEAWRLYQKSPEMTEIRDAMVAALPTEPTYTHTRPEEG